MKDHLRSLSLFLPIKVQEKIKYLHEGLSQRSFANQSKKTLNCGKFSLEAPSSHPIDDLASIQPYRDLCIGIAAKYFGKKYPNGAFLDVGANIGDTAAIMATYSDNDIHAIEPSSIYFDFLLKNARKIKSIKRCEQVFVSDGSNLTGTLSHWGGTAFVKEVSSTTVIKTKRLEDVASENTCFAKIDTDGFDFKILKAGLTWIEKHTPGLLFENQLESLNDLEESNDILNILHGLGYNFFLVWDDAGYLLLSTHDHKIIRHLNRYLLHRTKNSYAKHLHYFDILAIHKKDEDVWKLVEKWYEELETLQNLE